MRILIALVVIFLLAPAVRSQSAGLHRVNLDDIDRKVDPCTDFAEFANGAWHARNPIPASMDRWSRRWQAGETAKDKLKDILESLPKESTKGSTEQIIGDYYGACMDESRINARGIEPLKVWFAQVRRTSTGSRPNSSSSLRGASSGEITFGRSSSA